jgi:hypothetical protein
MRRSRKPWPRHTQPALERPSSKTTYDNELLGPRELAPDLRASLAGRELIDSDCEPHRELPACSPGRLAAATYETEVPAEVAPAAACSRFS